MQTHSSGQSAAPTADSRINVAASSRAFRFVEDASKTTQNAKMKGGIRLTET